MKSLFLDCSSGISGDMAVAALIDAGADKDVLQSVLDSIPVDGFKTEIKTVMKTGIAACDFNVILEHENHDHDMNFLFGESSVNSEYLIVNSGEQHHHVHCENDNVLQEEHHHHHHDNHGHEHNHNDHSHEHHHHHEENNSQFSTVNSQFHEHHHEHEHEHEHHHHNDNDHTHEHHHHDENNSQFSTVNSQLHTHGHHHEHEHSHHHGHHHEHRGLTEINSIIDKTKMTDSAKSLAKKIFDILADAESKAHAKPKDEVHFHEVGAVDSIVDIIAIAVCFDNLKIEKVYSTPLTEGTGTIRCAHGILNIPVPAVVNILQEHKIPLSIKNERGEFVTPTGAAFIAAINPTFDFPKNFTIERTGLGAGKREYKSLSILRAMIINEKSETESDTITKLECNIDDCTGENLGFVQELLFSCGAKDVTVVPCYMKKNRPAFLLHVICDNSEVQKFESIIFEHTTTIGIRRVQMERTKLVRKQIEVETPYGKIDAKEVIVNGKKRIYPEYESVKKIALEKGLSFIEVMRNVGNN